MKSHILILYPVVWLYFNNTEFLEHEAPIINLVTLFLSELLPEGPVVGDYAVFSGD